LTSVYQSWPTTTCRFWSELIWCWCHRERFRSKHPPRSADRLTTRPRSPRYRGGAPLGCALVDCDWSAGRSRGHHPLAIGRPPGCPPSEHHCPCRPSIHRRRSTRHRRRCGGRDGHVRALAKASLRLRAGQRDLAPARRSAASRWRSAAVQTNSFPKLRTSTTSPTLSTGPDGTSTNPWGSALLPGVPS
jgi:hypothetical protein